jgi:hypothetical protein
MMASNASNFAVASYSMEGLPEFTFSVVVVPGRESIVINLQRIACNSAHAAILRGIRYVEQGLAARPSDQLVVDQQPEC